LGNLPYNISSQVVVKLINERRFVRRAVLMFQKELAERLCAGPGSKTYGRLSVLLQYCAEVRLIRFVGADQFFPKPKVDSAVLRIDFKESMDPAVPLADDEKILARVVQAAFGRRRKTMRNALAGTLLGMDTQKAADVLKEVNIDPRRRAETLSVEEFVALANRINRSDNS
jgi:16S rRNA (adenine1518-N6/adenine1519-N6)-dimethyltransferase